MERAGGIPKIGDVLHKGRYRLQAELGKGAFAVAFAGQDLEKGRAVALKVLLKLTSQEDIAQFSQEAYRMMGLEHSNLVPFIEYVAMSEGLPPYIVMRLAPGGSLREEIKGRRARGELVPVRRSVFLLGEAGEGIGYLHRNKLVHRDIKPDNLLLAGQNELWVADLGIAQQLHSKESLVTTDFAGTPAYMAPEQIRKKAESASDQYALAIMAYELITGTLPFTGEFITVLMKQLQETPISLAQMAQSLNIKGINMNIVKALNDPVMQGLNKEPDKRHGSITLFTQTLRDRYQDAAGEKADRTVFEVVKLEKGVQQISPEDRIKKEVNALLQKGIELFNNKKYTEALSEIDKVVVLDQNNADAWFYKGLGLCRLGKYQETLEPYDRVLQLDPANVVAMRNKADSLNKLGRYEEALQMLNIALRLSPTLVEALNDKGHALKALGRREEAIAAYDQAIRINPQFSEAYYNKGVALDDLGRYEEAIAAYDQAIKINPQDSNAYNNKGTTLDELGRREEAIAAYDQAIRVNPQDSNAYNNKGTTLEALGRHKEAIRACDQAIRINPQLSQAYYNKGIALGALGRREEAIAAYDQAIRVNPQYSDAYNNKGNALNVLGRREEAIAAYDQAIQINPQYSNAYAGKGSVLCTLGKFKEASTCFQQALATNPSKAVVSYIEQVRKQYPGVDEQPKKETQQQTEVALTILVTEDLLKRVLDLLDEDRYEEALQVSDRIIALDPNNTTAYINKGEALNELGRREEAVNTYDQVIKLNPSSSLAYVNKGEILCELGRYEEASVCFQQALATNPSKQAVRFIQNIKKQYNL